jgi:Phosphotransferase enzyme family
VDAVDTLLRRYPQSPIVKDVLGTLDAAAIRAHAFSLVPEAVEIFHFAASVGAVFGLRLRDDSRVALKVNKLFTDERYFADVQALQAALAARGFPAPRPLRRVATATIDEWLDVGEFRDAHEPAVRRALVRELVRFQRVATETGLRPRRVVLRPEGALWPKPHNALFDFEATTAGAEWIDEIGAAAHAVADRPAGADVVGHTDWSAKHVRFDSELRATAVYDWDSVDVQPEPVVAGTAAGSFTYTEELGEDLDVWPSAEESLAFLAEYEEERGAPFTPDERAVARAACVYLRAYAARCHHAFGGDADHAELSQFADALL